MPAIGGFFGLEPVADAPPADGGALARWSAGRPGWLGFHNARSAFAHLLRGLRPPTVWLPRYLCADMRAAVQAVPSVGLRLYDVDAALRLTDDTLRTELRAGDLAVGVAYFGAPVCTALRSLASEREDVVWLEDRAQALEIEAGSALTQGWRLYSPRKLLGVADGGLLVGPVDRLPVAEMGPPPSGHAAAAELRSNAKTGAEIALAYDRYVAIERAHTVGHEAMSDATRSALETADITVPGERRRRNFAVLDARLAGLAAPVVERVRCASAPFGYPITLAADRDGVAGRLAAAGCFCAVHWRELVEDPIPPSAACALSRSMLTLPVDHRYSEADMDWLASRVLEEIS